MKSLLLIIFIALTITSACTSEKRNKTEPADITLLLETDVEIDSVFVSNLAQDKVFQFLPYSDEIAINTDYAINDLYNIIFYSRGNKEMNQIWLDGTNVVVKGRVGDKLKLETDTVIGSQLYYKSIAFQKMLPEVLKNSGGDRKLINPFLLESFEENIKNPLSAVIASNYFRQNINDKSELRKIYELQSKQDAAIRTHLLGPFEEVQRILLESRVDLSQFQFYNRAGDLTTVTLTEDKKYLIDFWFVGCAPCVEDHKMMAKRIGSLKSHDVEVVGISIDKDQKKWNNYLMKNGYNWQNVREADGYGEIASRDMLIHVFPTYILVDNSGNVLYRTFSFAEVARYLEM